MYGLLRDERGSVLVMVVAWLSVLVLVVTFVIDTANWFEHKRHLQMQVDAGALAGATNINGCFGATTPTIWTDPANLAIRTTARHYGGDTLNDASAYNPQVTNKANVTIYVNATKYPGDPGALDGDDYRPCQSDPDPKKGAFVDLKATDANLPWYLGGDVVPKIRAHARVSIRGIGTLSGSLPLAVEDVNPFAAGALFVNEDDGASTVLGRQVLTATTPSTLNGLSLIPWTGGPVSITIPSGTDQSKTGVVIALCSNKNLCGPTKGTAWLNGTVAVVCGQVFVTCYNGDQTGLELIHGYRSGGTGSSTAAILRDVSLTTGGLGACTDDSAPYFLLNGGCKVGAQVQLDFGVTGDPSKSVAQGGVNATVSVGIGNPNSFNCNLSWVSSSGTTSTWSASNCQTIASGAGKVALDLRWTTQTGSGGSKVNTTKDIATVARPFANDGATATQSYPVAYAQITTGSTCTSGIGNSVPYGSTNFCVGIGVIGNLRVAADTSDSTKILRFTGGSRTGALDCGGGNIRNDILYGCNVSVQRNPGEACPNATSPQDCLPIQTGAAVGQVRDGMNTRFAPADKCPDNNWSLYPAIPSGDPRVVPTIITLYRSFAGSGNTWVPVIDFATFYITGWDGSPSSGSCDANNQADPDPADKGGGRIWGHFITYVGDLGTSTPGSPCDFTAKSLSPCIPVMTQ